MEHTNGIFLIDSLGKILVVHPTNGDENAWSIPKGLHESGETSIDAAIRELKEETNITLTKEIMYYTALYLDLGISKYANRDKRLHAHLIILNENWSEAYPNVYCESTFTNKKTGEVQPENDIVKWDYLCNVEDKLHEAQKKYLKKIKELLVII